MLIVALGNPGKKYEWTRHNLGWLAADAFVSSALGSVQPSDSAWKKHHKADVLEFKTNGFSIIKPQTFMNESGAAVRAYLDFYQLDSSDIIVVHDDIDLEFGKMRIVKDSGAGGHNGVASLIDRLGTQDFIRLKLGVSNSKRARIPADKFVLQPFSFFEKIKVKRWLAEITEAIDCLLNKEVQECQNKFH